MIAMSPFRTGRAVFPGTAQHANRRLAVQRVANRVTVAFHVLQSRMAQKGDRRRGKPLNPDPATPATPCTTRRRTCRPSGSASANCGSTPASTSTSSSGGTRWTSPTGAAWWRRWSRCGSRTARWSAGSPRAWSSGPRRRQRPRGRPVPGRGGGRHRERGAAADARTEEEERP